MNYPAVRQSEVEACKRSKTYCKKEASKASIIMAAGNVRGSEMVHPF